MPIRTITACQYLDLPNGSPFDALIAAMHRDRAATFKSRLGWTVDVDPLSGWEIDAFDAPDVNPLYLISVDASGVYRGSLRLLPTTGPNMLRDVFPQLIDGDYIESATIWESSRICGGANALPELVIGIGEIAAQAGLTGIVTVVDARIKRVLRALGCAFDVIGTPRMIGGIECFAILFTDPIDERVRRRAGIVGAVFEAA